MASHVWFPSVEPSNQIPPEVFPETVQFVIVLFDAEQKILFVAVPVLNKYVGCFFAVFHKILSMKSLTQIKIWRIMLFVSPL